MERNSLRISVPTGVELTFGKGFLTGDEIKPSRTELGKKGTTFVFFDLPVGDYHYTGSGKGYFNRSKALYFSEEKAALGLSVFFDPGKPTGLGYEQLEPICDFNDEVLEKVIPAHPDLWPQYRDLFITPGLSPDKEPERVGTQEEMTAYLGKHVTPDKNGYLFNLGRTDGYGYDIPAAIFTKTDLRDAKTVEEAAALMRKNRRLTVQYQAQIHGNESAANEGAMGMIAKLGSEVGRAWLEEMDVLVVPRINPDGARAYTRNEVAKNINLNRDWVLCESAEIRAVQRLFRLFRPEVLVDGHEYTKRPGPKKGPFDDLMLGVAAGINNGKEIGSLNLELLKQAFADVQKEGFRVTTYPDCNYNTGLCIANAMDPSTGRLYFGLLGAMTILIESRGNHAGKESYLRRVAGQIATVHSIFRFVMAHNREIRRVVREERERIREAGRHYDPQRKFVLTTDISRSEETAWQMKRPLYNLETGELIDGENLASMYFFDTPLRSRPFPTAYVLPKGKSWEKQVTDIIRANGIKFGEIPAGGKALLRQYVGSAKRAFLDPEKEVTFPDGAYVLPLAQEAGLLLATLMEPDCTDATDGKGSLAQGGIITAAASLFPIYRYEKDLPEGKSLI